MILFIIPSNLQKSIATKKSKMVRRTIVNTAYYETAYDKSISKMEEREASQRKGAPNENNSYSTDEVK